MHRSNPLLAILRFLAHHPRRALLVVAAAAVPFAAATTGLRPDNSLSVWFVEDDPALLSYQEFLHEFGNDEVVAVGYHAPQSVFAPEERALQRQAAERLAGIEGVAEVLAADPLLERRGDSEVTRAFLHQAGLVSEDGRTATLLLRMEARDDLDAARGEILRDVEQVLDETLGAAGRTTHLAGTGVLYEALNQQTIRDSGIYFGLTLAVMALLLWLSLRSWRAVAVALAAPALAVPLTLGLFALAGRPLTQVTAILPVLILVIGLADAIHLISHYQAARRASPPATEEERRELVARSAARVAVPCLLTSVTTALGFLALASSRMAVVRDLGLFAAVGMLLVWVLAMGICTAALALREIPTAAAGARGGWLERLLDALARALPRRRRMVVAGSIAATTLLLVGATRLVVDTYTIELLPSGHVVREDSDWMQANAGFYTPLEFTVRSAGEGGVRQAEILAGVEEWQRRAEARAEVGRTFGYREALATASAADAGSLSSYLSADGRSARVTAYVEMMSARRIAEVARALEGEGMEIFGTAATVRAAGYLPLYVRIIDYVVESTVWGLLLAFLVVFAVLALFLGSGRLLVCAVAANLFPVALVFGVMGWAGIPLEVATAMIGAIVLGIVVDDTIHFLYRYRVERRTRGVEAAVGETIRGAGRPIVLTSIILILGFSVLVVSGSKSIVYFGILAGLAVGGALLADLLLLPALLLGGRGDAAQRTDAPPPERPSTKLVGSQS
ncbi:hypothetical protein BH24GEM3_BH24GEM3_13920 [soil metagenome]